MDSTTKQKIAEVIADLTNGDAMFSAFDVTSQLRNVHGLTVFHSEVRKEVHAAFQSMQMPSDYISTYHSFTGNDGTPVKANVYHPSWEDVSKYDPKALGGDQTSGPFDVDGRGRICVRKNIVSKLGLNPGNLVYLGWDANKTTPILSKYNPAIPPGVTPGRAIMVDKSGNIRVRAKTLGGFSKYKIKSYAGTLTIIPA